MFVDAWEAANDSLSEFLIYYQTNYLPNVN